MTYNWQHKDWPNFQYDLEALRPLFLEFALAWAEFNGMEKGLSSELEEEAMINTMVSEAIKSSAIEGEFFSREVVMSSIKNKLGLSQIPEKVKDRYATGIANLMVEVRSGYKEPLSAEMLKNWHKILFAHAKNLIVGNWRKGENPMLVVSGAIGREIIHFEAPPAKQVPSEMEAMIDWYNQSSPPSNDPVGSALLKSAITHLYFESIHPFEDGNGRIGRALAEKALSQGLEKPALLSISKTIDADKSAYYQALKKAQRGMEITTWIDYFIRLIIASQRDANSQISFLLRKVKYFEKYKKDMEERHAKVIGKMFDAGPEGFQGGMSAKKYMSITHVSKATATRDLQYLHETGMLTKSGAGRSVRYGLNLD